MLDRTRYWLFAGALSVLWFAPEAWTAYAMHEMMSAPETICEPVQVDVTCSCETVEASPAEKPRHVVTGARDGSQYWWE